MIVLVICIVALATYCMQLVFFFIKDSVAFWYFLQLLKAFWFVAFQSLALTHFSPMFQLCSPRKRHKTSGFLIFSGSIEETIHMKFVKWG